MSAESLISTITANSIANSNKLIDSARTYADQAVSQSFLAFGAFPDRVINPDFLPLNLTTFDPDVDLRDSYLNRFNVVNGALNAQLPGLMDSFITGNFGGPNCWPELGDKLCGWLNTDGNFLQDGEELKMRAAIRDRAFESIKPVLAANMSDASSRGHIVPPDWMWGANNDTYNTAIKEVAKGDRELTIELVKMRLDWLDKVIGHIIDMRSKAIQAGLQYIDNIYKSAAAGDRNASGYVSSYKSFYDALNGYYGAIGQVNELRYKVAAKNADLGQHATDTFVTATLGSLNTRATTTTELAKSMGILAGSVSSGLNTLASATNNTNIAQ